MTEVAVFTKTQALPAIGRKIIVIRATAVANNATITLQETDLRDARIMSAYPTTVTNYNGSLLGSISTSGSVIMCTHGGGLNWVIAVEGTQ